jgi:hypothetical protein
MLSWCYHRCPHFSRSIDKTAESIEETLDFLPAEALERGTIFLKKLEAILHNLCSPIALLASVYHLLPL